MVHGYLYVSFRLNVQFPSSVHRNSHFICSRDMERLTQGLMVDFVRNIAVPRRRLLFWAALLFAFVMAIIPYPPQVPGEPNDKVQHMIAFATLGALGAWAYAQAALLQLLGGLSLFGALIEVVQAIPALHRDSDVKDWIADTIACGLVLLLIRWRRARARVAARQQQ